jgi:hypothetical protein
MPGEHHDIPYGLTVSEPVALPAFAAAETLTEVGALTEFVVTLKTTVLCPADTMAVDGIEATALAPAVTARFTVVLVSTVCCMITRT